MYTDKKPEPLIEGKGLCKYYDGKGGRLFQEKKLLKAVDQLDFCIYPGEVFGLVGESGCGKSTLGKMLANVITPTKGEIIYSGNPITQKNREFKRKIQMVFQDPYSSLNPKKKIGWILEEPLKLHTALSFQERRIKVREMLELTGLDFAYERAYPNELSGGQRQRVSIAAALMLDPELIIADESVSALDVSIQSQILNLLKHLQKTKNLTYLFISHDLNVVHYMSDRIGVMYLGKLMEVGRVNDLFYTPAHPYTKALLSSMPSVNMEERRERILLNGDIPNMANPPTGCPFQTRCREVGAGCKESCPDLQEIGEGHLVRCHYAQKDKYKENER